MPRINPKAPNQYPWYVRVIFWLQQKKYGQILLPAKFWGLAPKVFLGLTYFFRGVDRSSSPITPQLRNLIFIHVSKIIHCPFCEDINSSRYIESLGDKDLLDELAKFETSDRLSKKEKAALKYAEGMTLTPISVSDAQFSDLKNHFSNDEIVELTALIAFQNCSARFNSALEIPSQGFYSN